MTYFLEQNLNLKMNFLDGGTKVCFLNFQISEFWATAFFFGLVLGHCWMILLTQGCLKA